MTIFARELEVIKFGSPTPKNEWKQEMARQGKNVVITPKDSRLQSKIMHNIQTQRYSQRFLRKTI